MELTRAPEGPTPLIFFKVRRSPISRGVLRRPSQLHLRDPPPPPSALPADPASAGASFRASAPGARAPLRFISHVRAGRSSPAELSGAAVSSPCRSSLGRASFPASAFGAVAPLRFISPVRAGRSSPRNFPAPLSAVHTGPSAAAVSSSRRSGLGRRLLHGFCSWGGNASPLHVPHARRSLFSRGTLRRRCQLSLPIRRRPAPPSRPRLPGL